MKTTTLFLLTFLLCFPLAAQRTYEDLRGRFAIDLPDGYTLSPQTNENVFEFKGDGMPMIVAFVEGDDDPASLFSQGMISVNSSLTGTEKVGDVLDANLNGNPARLGTYKGGVKGNENIILYALLGGVGLGSDGVYYFTFFNEADYNSEAKDPIVSSYHTIRRPGQELSGVSQSEVYAGDVMMNASAGEGNTITSDPFRFEYSSMHLDFPAGWSQQELGRGVPKEMIGWFNYKKESSGNLQVYSYEGLIWSPKTVGDVADGVLLAAMPDAQLVASSKEKLESGNKAEIKEYKGTSVVDGKEIALGGLTIVLKSGKHNLFFLAFSSLESMSSYRQKVLEVAASAP